MIKKLIHQTKRWLMLLSMSASSLSMTAQSATYGNTFVHSGAEAAVHSVLQTFTSGGAAPLDGIVGTERTSPKGYVGFVGTASWTGASDARHIDGYAQTYMTSSFIFPIGDNGRYRPCRVSTASVSQPASAAYFRANPSTAITSSLKGGNEPALPSGTYSTSSKAADVRFVSTSEYWDINGAGGTQLTLTWDASSGIAAMTGSNLSKLTIVGWDGTQWVAISSAVDASSILGGTSTVGSGSITTTAAITPNTYDVYSLAAFCPVSAPTALSISRNAVCSGSSITLSATTVSDTLKWFRDAALTQFVGRGTSLTVTPTASTRYYAAHISGVCISDAVSDSVTVATNCPSFPIADTSVRNPALGTPISVGPSIATPTGGSVSAAIIGGFSRRAADAQSINPLTGLVTLTPNDTAFVGQDTLVRQICFTIGGITTCDTSYIVINNRAPNTTDTDTTGLNTPKVLAALTPVIFEGGSPTTTTSSPKVTVTGGIPTYTPSPGFVGIDTQYVYRCDASSPVNCDTTRLIVSVLLQIADSTKGTTTNTPVTLGPKVTPNPNVSDNITASNGSIVKNPDGSFTYTPNPNFVGTDTLRRIVCTTVPVYCDTSYTIINVAPSYADSTKTTTQGTPVTAGTPIAVMPGSSLSVTKTGPSSGTAVLNPNGTVTYTPNPNFVGVDTVKRIVCVTFTDATQKCDTSLMVFQVAPKQNDTVVKTPINTPLANVGLPIIPGPGTTLVTTATPKHGTATTNPDGTINYTPAPNFVGLDTVTKIVCATTASITVCDTSLVIFNVTGTTPDGSGTTTQNTAVTLQPIVTPGPGATVSVTASAPNGTTVVNPNGTVSYTPNTNTIGTDTVTRIICVTTTEGVICDTSKIVINVAPSYADSTKTTKQGTPVTAGTPVAVMPGSTLSVTKTGPSNGTAVVNPDGTITYTPNPSFVGADTVQRIVCVTFADATQKCDTSLLIFGVTPSLPDTKDTAILNGGSIVIGTPITGASTSVAATSQFGSVSVNPDGTVTYTPSPNFVGIDSVRRIVCYTLPNPDICDTSYIVMIVAPLLQDSSKTTKMNSPIVAGNPLILGPGATQQLLGPANGTVSVLADGTLRYTPNNKVVGNDTIRRIVCVQGICDTAVYVFKILPDVKDTVVAAQQGTPVTISGPGLTAVGGAVLSYAKAAGPSNGTATVDPTTGAVSYTPRPGFVGIDTVVVNSCITSDGGIIICEPHLVVIKVAIVNKTSPDIATGSKNVQIAGILGTNDQVLAGTTYGNPIASASNPSSTLPKVNADGTYTFTATVAGTYTFTIAVCPPGQIVGCPTETLTITVIDPDRTDNKPIVNTDYPITRPNSPVKVNVLANDASGNSGFPLNKSSLTVSTAPKNGTATVNADGTISYIPKPGFVGVDTFYYTVCDSVSPPNCNSAMVIVRVTDEDIIDVQDDLIGGKGVLAGNTLANDKFPIGSKPYVKPQDVIIPGKGRFVIDSFGNYKWTPEPGFSGNVQIVITTCDGKTPETCFTSTLHIAATNTAVLLAIPNYFSPNGDGVNDVWNLDDLLSRYPNAKALIYNRWGNIVWRSTGPYGYANSGKNVWFGQVEGSSDNVPDGVYYYLLELEDEFKTSKTGFIEIMRQ